jgi:excisionase family DNA binding protein
MKPVVEEPESIRALATVTLDAKALDELGPQTLDRLADLVAKRLAAREAAGQVPLLTIADAAKVAQLSDSTVRKAIRLGELKVAGYVGKRARLRRADVEAWLADGNPPASGGLVGNGAPPRRRARASYSRVLGDALISIAQGGASR